VLGLRRSALPVDGASVRKSKKASLTVVSAHTGMTNSAKRKAIGRTMRNAVIDGDATGCCSVENQAFFRDVITEVVQGQGARVVSHISDCLFDIVVGLDREQRTKNLVLHYRHFFVHVENQARRQSMKIIAGKVLVGRI